MNILRRKTIKRQKGNLTDVLRKDNCKNIVPSANTLEEAINYIKKFYGTTKGACVKHIKAYHIHTKYFHLCISY